MAKTASLLRYPGGKTRAIKTLWDFIPEGTEEICSPFFGGGSFELHCANNGIKVHGYDIFKPVVEFWQCARNDPKRLAGEIKKYHPLSKDEFYKLQKSQTSGKSKYTRAAVFFVLNRASFSGSTLSGGMSPGHPRFNKAAIERVENFSERKFNVKCLSFEKSIALHNKDLLYLDPPYLIENFLYGKKGNTHRGFNHKLLRDILVKRDKWILSYNNCEEIRQMYWGYKMLYPEWKYGMSADKNSKEILVISKDIERQAIDRLKEWGNIEA